MEYIFLPFQNTVNKIVRRNFGIDFFRSIISKPTELNGDFIRFFFTVAAKLCLSILPKVDLYM